MEFNRESGFVNNNLFCIYAASFYVLGMLIVSVIQLVVR